ncbi:MAG: ATP-binding protein [Oscillospiraceae bacterium]|nr:ATP-binding protein [Oscillospiraceae bacterium]
MGLFKSSSIKKRLYLSFACMWAIMIFFAFFRGQQLNAVMNRYNHAMETLNIQQQYIGNIVTELNMLRFNDLIVGAFSDYPELYQRINPLLVDRETNISSLHQALYHYRSAVVADGILTAEDAEIHVAILYDMINTLYNYYIPSGDAMVAAIEMEDADKFADALYVNFSLGYSLTRMAWELRDRTFVFVTYVTETMHYYDQIEDRIFNVATVIGISIAILLAVLLAHTIQKPISELKAAMAEVTSGNMTHPIRMEYNDDIGRLSHDIADMVESVSKMIDTAAAQKYRIEQQEIYEAQIQKALKEAKAASEAKTSFIANTSHEIRTPMNSIIGYCELAMDDDIPDKSKEYLNNVLTNAKWLLTIINDIMDFSKIEAGKTELDTIAFDINSVIEDGRTAVAHEVEKKRLKLNIDINTPAKKVLVGDRVKLTQICMNLLSNSVKFTDSGFVSCVVTTAEQDEKTCKLKFEFYDTGIGMTEDQIEKVFDPFVQANASTTRRFGGTGLGLSIAANYIRAMGGKLEVQSVLNGGSKFFFQLPFELADNIGSMPEKTNVIAKPEFDNEEILVVEDNEMNQGVMCEHLKRVRLTPIIAVNGEVAVDMVRNRKETGKPPFYLIFMDLHMPVMDGIEATSRIRDLDVATPIIATTATMLNEAGEAFGSNTMDGYITKPFTTGELYKILLKFLSPVSNTETLIDEGENGQKTLNLKRMFLKQNHDILSKITEAIEIGDLVVAHRLAHSLKGNAGLIGETRLQSVAGEIEECLTNQPPSRELLDELKVELKPVIEKISELVESVKSQTEVAEVRKEDAMQTLDELEALVSNHDAKVIDYIDKLRGIPEAETLIEQLENFDIKEASFTLSTLKSKLSNS